MKNTLSITKNCVCSCVDSIADGTNSIFVAVDVGNVVNPQLKVWLNDTLKSTTSLTANNINYVNIPPELFAANGVIKFQYLDSSYTGNVFEIHFPAILEGNLSVQKLMPYVFNAKYTKSGAVTITVDNALSTTSTNPVQNKVITNKIIEIDSDITGLEGSVDLLNNNSFKYSDIGIGCYIPGNTHQVINLDTSEIDGTVLFFEPIIKYQPAWIMANAGYNDDNGFFIGLYNTFSNPLEDFIICRVVYI